MAGFYIDRTLRAELATLVTNYKCIISKKNHSDLNNLYEFNMYEHMLLVHYNVQGIYLTSLKPENAKGFFKFNILIQTH